MVKKIIRYPSPSLRERCSEVTWPLSTEVSDHLNDLRDTLDATPNGIALASNQIIPKGFRVFVVKTKLPWPLVRSMSGEAVPEIVINPKVEAYPPHEIDGGLEAEWAKHDAFVEGCLSVPELGIPNPRAFWVEMEYSTPEGERRVFIAKALTARMIQHEVDHLDGLLIVDSLDKQSQTELYKRVVRNRKAGK
jgi:peptide deformylase